MLTTSKMDAYVLTAPPYYPEWQRHEGFENRYTTTIKDGVSLYRCPLYVPKKITTFKRLLHLCSFALSSAFRLFSLVRLKPSVVFLVQPTLFCAPATLLYCKITGANSIMHIQDFEVDAMLGLGLSRGGRLKRFATGIESWLLKKFDVVSSISFSMLENARAKGVDEKKLLFFPNWADTNFVTPDVSGDAIRAEWGFTQNDKVVLYSGNIGQKQGLEIILEAADTFKANELIKFIIIGNGVYREKLQQMALERGLTNVQFKQLQPWELVPQILAMADVHLVVQKRGAADAVLPSKLTNILSVGGHALVTADTDTELGKIAQKYPGIYQCVEPENTNAFIEGLEYCLGLDTKSCNAIAREYAVDNLSKERVISRFVEDIRGLCGSV